MARDKRGITANERCDKGTEGQRANPANHKPKFISRSKVGQIALHESGRKRAPPLHMERVDAKRCMALHCGE